MTDLVCKENRRPWYLRFHDLMPYRVREILLVSSPYDAFTLEEDGHLTESIFTKYSELNLSAAPRITHVSTGAKAMEMLAERRFDLVVTMVRIADTDVSDFGRKVKELYPGIPVILLVLTEADLKNFPGGVDPSAVDRVWVWTGDAKILLSIIKLVEDQLNAEHDARVAGVRVMIVVEDSIRRYSSFLSQLYSEMIAQSESLIAEGVNELHRVMRVQTRPKILLVTNYEEAVACYRRFKQNVLAIISDVEFPRGGHENPTAGFDFVKLVRSEDPELPILMQSAESRNARIAEEMGLHFVEKNSSVLIRQVQRFVNESLGFGDFVFRLPDRTEVARARDMYELEHLLARVPAESLQFHATRNHFSLWLMARSMFSLAETLRPQQAEALGGVEELRKFLLDALKKARIQEQQGVITDVDREQVTIENEFIRIRKGSIGGKARGVAFVSSQLACQEMENRFPGLKIKMPRSFVIGTEEFDYFTRVNNIFEGGSIADTQLEDSQILDRCLRGRLSDELLGSLRRLIHNVHCPLAVRSSSLLEDSQLQPFAGIYATYMLPNNDPDPEARLEELCKAIKAVFASTFFEDARAYISSTPYSIDEEKMGVLIQEMVGRSYGDRFYPAISGVGLSYNYYPIGHQKAEDGVALVAVGLGHTIVHGGAALQFSPRSPQILPQFGSAQDVLRYSQSQFYGLNLRKNRISPGDHSESSLKLYDLERAEKDGVLSLMGSVYCREDDVIRDNLSVVGTRVVTFNNILKWEAMPLAPALAELLSLFKEGLGYAVELEFAVDKGNRQQGPSLYVLQVRPQSLQVLSGSVDPGRYAPDQLLCFTDRSLGHGVIDNVRDIVYVRRNDLECDETPGVADEVGQINGKLFSSRTPYLLIGPGRWGSSDPRLGVPVRWSQIAGAKLIIETSFADRDVEPSQGTHFFHNMTSFQIGYLSLARHDLRGGSSEKRVLDQAWLDQLPAVSESKNVRHVHLDKPLKAYLDGRKGSATILKE